MTPPPSLAILMTAREYARTPIASPEVIISARIILDIGPPSSAIAHDRMPAALRPALGNYRRIFVDANRYDTRLIGSRREKRRERSSRLFLSLRRDRADIERSKSARITAVCKSDTILRYKLGSRDVKLGARLATIFGDRCTSRAFGF